MMTDSAPPRHVGTLAPLLEKAVDYAGLFPPAKLSMSAAVQNYAGYIAGESSWMLGRFILPLSRLDEFEAESRDLLSDRGGPVWHLSGLCGPDLRGGMNIVREFNTRHAPAQRTGSAVIDALELKASSPREILDQKESDPSVMRFYEIPSDRDPEDLVAALSAIGAGGKIRTGGISEDAFPEAGQVIRFLDACIRYNVPYKATAGLHHPLRGRYRLTYEPQSPSGMMFGFLNVFLAGAFLASGMSKDDAEQILREESADAFRFGVDGVTWREYRLEPEALRLTRTLNTVSFGSCSFIEPVEELRELGMMS